MFMGEMNRHQLGKVARQYYLENFTVRQIADKLNVSMSTVSRMLTRAKREHIVEITIHDVHADFRNIEIELESAFEIKECVVVPASEKTESMYSDMARAVAEVFERFIHNNTHLGVSWGETLKAIGDNLPVSRPKHVHVVPIIGAMGTIETGIYPNSIAKSFADKLGGVSYLINSPAILGSKKMRNSVLRDRNFARVNAIWNKIDVVLLSVSNLERDASVSKFRIFSSQELEYLRSIGIVCATNFNMLNAEGQPVGQKISDRIINMDMGRLRKVKTIILAACGASKVEAILAALRGQILDILITDNETAKAVLKRHSVLSSQKTPSRD